MSGLIFALFASSEPTIPVVKHRGAFFKKQAVVGESDRQT
jgi:hypothetical protein